MWLAVDRERGVSSSLLFVSLTFNFLFGPFPCVSVDFPNYHLPIYPFHILCDLTLELF